MLLLKMFRRGDADTLETEAPEKLAADTEFLTQSILTEPEALVGASVEILQKSADEEAEKAAAAAGPQFDPTAPATGVATVTDTVQAVSADGTKVELPAGSYPAGSTTSWHGAWTAARSPFALQWASSRSDPGNLESVGRLSFTS